MSTGTFSASSLSMQTRVRTLSGREKNRGFTLLELLAVITIIGVLSAIVIGVGRHAATASKVARAKAELAALSAALEAYKRQYGDYPRVASDANLDDVTSGEQLHLALSGQRGPALTATRILPQQRILFERSRFTMADLRAPDDAAENHFVDPWGNAYRYAYKPAGSWTNSSYILACAGPDEMITLPLPATGNLDATYETTTRDGKPVNVDNIYANRN